VHAPIFCYHKKQERKIECEKRKEGAA